MGWRNLPLRALSVGNVYFGVPFLIVAGGLELDLAQLIWG